MSFLRLPRTLDLIEHERTVTPYLQGEITHGTVGTLDAAGQVFQGATRDLYSATLFVVPAGNVTRRPSTAVQ